MWYDLKNRIKINKTIDVENQKLTELEKKYWSDITLRIIELIKYLASQCLALRGTSDKLNDRNNDNFLKLIELFAKFDSVVETRVNRTLKSKYKTNYLSKDIQNKIIQLLGDHIRNQFLFQCITS